MFKERGKLTLITIGYILLSAIFLYIFAQVVFHFGKHPIHLSDLFRNIIKWIFIGALVYAVLQLLWLFGQGLVWFIKWLFIEPYQERRKKRAHKK
jgi:drug/metabolite transporter (DMT)-like permease